MAWYNKEGCEVCNNTGVVPVSETDENPFNLTQAYCSCCNLNITSEDLDYLFDLDMDTSRYFDTMSDAPRFNTTEEMFDWLFKKDE